MMTRRAFLSGATKTTVTLLLTPLVACSSSSSPTTISTSPTEPGGGCNGVASTSTVVQGHTHAVCVDETLLTSPPADGVTITTTLANDHAHAVVLAFEDLRTIQNGGTASVTTTTVSGHVHGFGIRRAG